MDIAEKIKQAKREYYKIGELTTRIKLSYITSVIGKKKRLQ